MFGDCTFVTVPNHGHTPGHHSLRLKLASVEIILAANTCYFRKTPGDLHLPNHLYDKQQIMEALKMLRRLQTAGAGLICGHVPDIWQDVPQAPLEQT